MEETVIRRRYVPSRKNGSRVFIEPRENRSLLAIVEKKKKDTSLILIASEISPFAITDCTEKGGGMKRIFGTLICDKVRCIFLNSYNQVLEQSNA